VVGRRGSGGLRDSGGGVSARRGDQGLGIFPLSLAGQEDGLSGRWGGSRVSASGIARERARCGSENFALAGGPGLSVAGLGLGQNWF
jgi:hypothetical protein